VAVRFVLPIHFPGVIGPCALQRINIVTVNLL